MKKIYSKQIFDSKNPHPALMLHEILQDELVGTYIADVIVGLYDDDDDDTNQEEEKKIKSVMIGNSKMVGDNICRSIYLDSLSKKDQEDWTQGILAGQEATTIAFMLLLLPHLKSIAFSSHQDFPDEIFQVVAGIPSASQEDTKAVHPLGHLTDMSLNRGVNEYNDWYNFFRPFADLPSIRSLSGHGINGFNLGWHHVKPYESIRSLKFEKSCIDAKSFDDLIKAASDLREFAYTYDFDPSNAPSDATYA